MLVSIVAIVVAIIGLLVPFWGFGCIALAIVVVQGNWPLALILGMCFDILYGTPTGSLHIVAIPFTLATLVSLSIRFFLVKHMRDQETYTL